MHRSIEFYRAANGSCPVENFLDALTPRYAQKVLWVLRLIERLDRVPVKYFRKLSGADEIWECRVATPGGAFRVFCFFVKGDRLVATHGYSKKTPKTEQRQIHRAQELRRDYLRRHQELMP